MARSNWQQLSASEKTAWRDERRREAMAKMEHAVTALQNSEEWKAALRMRRTLCRYSFANTIFLWAQRPDIGLCGSYTQWKALGRYPKKGCQKLMVWAPIIRKVEEESSDGSKQARRKAVGFRAVKSVIDYRDTEGKPLPDLKERTPLTQDSPVIQAVIAAYTAFAADHRVPVAYTTLPDAPEAANGVCRYTKDGPTIEIRETLAPLDRAKVLVHELVHAVAQPAPGRRGKTNEPHTPGADDARLSAPRRTYAENELEAESVAYLLLDELGIEDPFDNAALYLASYADNPEQLVAMGEAIHQTAERISAGVHSHLERILGRETAESLGYRQRDPFKGVPDDEGVDEDVAGVGESVAVPAGPPLGSAETTSWDQPERSAALPLRRVGPDGLQSGNGVTDPALSRPVQSPSPVRVGSAPEGSPLGPVQEPIEQLAGRYSRDVGR